MAKIRLNQSEKDSISAAVEKAEKNTSGEIVTAVIRESYDYAIYEMIFALAAGFVYFMVMLFFTGKIEQFLQSLFWDYSTNHVIAFYGFSIFLVIALFYFLANISYLDRLIVPDRTMKRKVRERAVRYFVESGVQTTRDRTGILIFVSILEQRVELMADSGISAKIETERWQSIVDDIVIGIKKGSFPAALIRGVETCGEILKTHFPIKTDDQNELENELKILE